MDKTKLLLIAQAFDLGTISEQKARSLLIDIQKPVSPKFPEDRIEGGEETKIVKSKNN